METSAMTSQLGLQTLDLGAQGVLLTSIMFVLFGEFLHLGLEILDVLLLSFAEGSLSRPVLRFAFLHGTPLATGRSTAETGDDLAVVGSLVSIFRPGFLAVFSPPSFFSCRFAPPSASSSASSGTLRFSCSSTATRLSLFCSSSKSNASQSRLLLSRLLLSRKLRSGLSSPSRSSGSEGEPKRVSSGSGAIVVAAVVVVTVTVVGTRRRVLSVVDDGRRENMKRGDDVVMESCAQPAVPHLWM